MSDDYVADALAAGIKKASDDNGSFENFSLKDMIAADKYQRSKANIANPFLVVSKATIIAPGPVQ